MDYKTQMNENDLQYDIIKDYASWYENIVKKILKPYTIGSLSPIQSSLEARRGMGLKKYGEYSFQSSFKNTISSPTVQHIQEELLDCFNYLAHEHVKASFLYPSQIPAITNLLLNLKELFQDVLRLEKSINEERNS